MQSYQMLSFSGINQISVSKGQIFSQYIQLERKKKTQEDNFLIHHI